VLQLSAEARRILGLEKNAVQRNVDFFNLIHPEDRDRLLKVIWGARNDFARGIADVRIVRDDGSQLLIRIVAGPTVAEDGSPAVAGTIEDITVDETSELDEAAACRLRFERELLEAIDQDELFVEYQPIRSLSEERYVGAEALVRWQHPHLGPLQPDAFIGVAEESGAIVPLGAFVLRRACRELRRWLDAGVAQDVTMSVNLSAAQFRKAGFVEILADAIAETRLPQGALVLEVTESLLVEGALRAEILQAIREQGVRIAIDDFGTKYSALSYLSHLSVDALKVDESFVRSIDSEPSRTVVTAVAALGRALGLHVTAEGIETEAQLELVQSAGCDAAQGFLFSPPVSGEECLRLLHRQPPT
jgi:PAS domain S-box-containing protein